MLEKLFVYSLALILWPLNILAIFGYIAFQIALGIAVLFGAYSWLKLLF